MPTDEDPLGGYVSTRISVSPTHYTFLKKGDGGANTPGVTTGVLSRTTCCCRRTPCARGDNWSNLQLVKPPTGQITNWSNSSGTPPPATSAAFTAHTPPWHGRRYGVFSGSRMVDVRLPGKGNLNSHGARPVHLIITMIKWIRTSRLSIKKSLYT